MSRTFLDNLSLEKKSRRQFTFYAHVTFKMIVVKVVRVVTVVIIVSDQNY